MLMLIFKKLQRCSINQLDLLLRCQTLTQVFRLRVDYLAMPLYTKLQFISISQHDLCFKWQTLIEVMMLSGHLVYGNNCSDIGRRTKQSHTDLLHFINQHDLLFRWQTLTEALKLRVQPSQSILFTQANCSIVLTQVLFYPVIRPHLN